MSRRTAKYLGLGKGDKNLPFFGGGEVSNMEAFEISDGHSPYQRNGRVKGYSTEKRPGRYVVQNVSNYGNATSIGAIQPSIEHTGGLVIGTAQGDYLYVKGDTMVVNNVMSLSHSALKKDNWFEFGGKLYKLNPAFPMTRFEISGGTMSSTLLPTILPAFPSFGVEFSNLAVVSGVAGNLDKIYVSQYNDAETYAIPTTTGIQTDEYVFPGEVTGLASNNNSLFVFGRTFIYQTDRNSIGALNSVQRFVFTPLMVTEGAITQKLIVVAGNKIYYLTPTNKIMMISRNAGLNGAFDVVDISHRKYKGITNLMNAIPRGDYDGVGGKRNVQDLAFALYHEHDGIIKFHLQNGILDGSTEYPNSLTIVYDLGIDEFFVDDYVTSDLAYLDGAIFHGNQSTDYLMGDEWNTSMYCITPTSKLCQDEKGLNDDFYPIHFIRRSKAITFGDPSRKKTIWQARTFLSANNNAQVYQRIYMDGEPFDHGDTMGIGKLINTVDTFRPQEWRDPQGTYWGMDMLPAQIGKSGTIPTDTDYWRSLQYQNVGPISRARMRYMTQVIETSEFPYDHRGYVFEVVWEERSLNARMKLIDFDLLIENEDELETHISIKY